MPAPKKGTEYVCGVCGTTVMVTECGYSGMDTLVCCEAPMKAKTAKKKSKPKKK